MTVSAFFVWFKETNSYYVLVPVYDLRDSAGLFNMYTDVAKISDRPRLDWSQVGPTAFALVFYQVNFQREQYLNSALTGIGILLE